MLHTQRDDHRRGWIQCALSVWVREAASGAWHWHAHTRSRDAPRCTAQINLLAHGNEDVQREAAARLVLSAAFSKLLANTHAGSSDFGDLIIWRRLPREFILWTEPHEGPVRFNQEKLYILTKGNMSKPEIWSHEKAFQLLQYSYQQQQNTQRA